MTVATTAELLAPPGPDEPAPATLEVASRRFGTLSVGEDRIFTLDAGLVGFPEARRFVLLDHRPGSPFKWLLCVDEPELGFAVVDPADFVPGHAPPLERAAELLGTTPADVAVLVLVNIPREPTEIFLNLLAPIVVDVRARRGRQLVLEDPALDPAHRIPLVAPR
jgi:flagellar assembly factor FliW